MNMEKLNFVRDGVSRLPPGFRFQPTDEELVFQYLKSKIFGLPLPASIIPELNNVSAFDPWDLPGDSEQERYFFSNEVNNRGNGWSVSRTTRSGYWKATGSDERITSSSSRKNNRLRGLKKSFVFHIGKPPHGSGTYWFMHRYSLLVLNSLSSSQVSMTEMEEWTICHVFLKRMRRNDDDDDDDDDDDVDAVYSSCSSSLSSSSGKTEVSSTRFDQSDTEETSS